MSKKDVATQTSDIVEFLFDLNITTDQIYNKKEIKIIHNHTEECVNDCKFKILCDIKPSYEQDWDILDEIYFFSIKL